MDFPQDYLTIQDFQKHIEKVFDILRELKNHVFEKVNQENAT
jgi:hypothetical protein